jgi:uncharacterized protein YegP (UPF0339 family)
MSASKVELRKTEGIDQPYHFVIKAANGEVVLTSENYHNKADAEEQAKAEAVIHQAEYIDASKE